MCTTLCLQCVLRPCTSVKWWHMALMPGTPTYMVSLPSDPEAGPAGVKVAASACTVPIRACHACTTPAPPAQSSAQAPWSVHDALPLHQTSPESRLQLSMKYEVSVREYRFAQFCGNLCKCWSGPRHGVRTDSMEWPQYQQQAN